MTALILANTQIRQDPAGRFCLNDLHQASGGESRHKPGNWLMLGKTRELIAEVESQQGVLEIQQAPVHVVNDGFGNGTYAVKELVYAYAMWISAAFHLHVIRAYDAMVTAQRADLAPPLPLAPQHRADQFVSAGRIFSAAMRTARTLRMPPAQAIRAAVDCAARHTGIHLGEEIGVDINTLGRDDTVRTPIAQAIAEYVASRDEVTLDEVSTAVGIGRPGASATQREAARVLTALGWRSKRCRRREGGFYTPWRRSLNA